MKSLIFAAAGLSLAIGQARACDNLADSNPSCAQWAALSGDPAADRCTVARLDEKRLEYAFDPTRPRTVADDPLPPHGVIMQELQEANARIARECGEGN